jgi:hypothetical protein
LENKGESKVFTKLNVTMIKQIERGDADSSGSTLRTIGIVVLVVSVVTLIGLAVLNGAQEAADKINAATFDPLNK